VPFRARRPSARARAGPALDIRLTAGANWNELLSGTNAIGTALSVGGPVRVHGAEQFCAGIKPWTCSATAVRDPASGELLGVVDISGLRNSFNRNWLALAVRGLDGSHRRARQDDDDAQAFSAHDGRLYPLGAQPVR
jgi:transcriptional regulator of acetoin/glycerol metabolism